MSYTVQEIADALGAEAYGDVNIELEAVAEPANATEQHLALAMKPEYAEGLSTGEAKAALLWDGADWQSFGLKAAIVATRPRASMAGLTRVFDPGQGWEPGIHPSAVVHETAQLGQNVTVGPNAVICAGATVGDGTTVGPLAFVGTDTVIGKDGFLREGARIGARVVIGDRFIAQPNAAIGGDGFSYVTPELSDIEQVRGTLTSDVDSKNQKYMRIHSLGSVRIGDDVEFGANSAIDRGTVRDSAVGNGSKIDNLVQIGHNCVIGENCLLCGCVGVAGSVTVGNNVVLGGQTGVTDNIYIGDNVITGGGTKIMGNIPKGKVLMGYPPIKMADYGDHYKNIRRLSRLYADVAELKKRVPKPNESD